MINKKDLGEEIRQVSSLGQLVEVYGEIASFRMKKIRDFVLKNRDFLNSINDIFRDALGSYSRKLAQLVAKGKLKKGGKVTFLAHNGKTVAVFISANTGFYGGIVQATYRKFLEETRDADVEITIIGRLGRSLFVGAQPKTPYTYFELKDYGVDRKKIAEVVRHLVQYEKIVVYYGRYNTVITQIPSRFSISAGTEVGKDDGRNQMIYIFEPSVEKILMFFETEIFASLFDQSIRESQLAKFASRILAMDKADQNIENKLKELRLERLKLSHKLGARKQLDSLSSVMFSDAA
jgi:F0F1-type ATP synthase gamma subunit